MNVAAYDAEDFARDLNVSHETLADFQEWQRLLVQWNKRINLVAPKTLPEFWQRHAFDSAQLFSHIPNNTKTILDLGSGGGFPGLALGIYCKHKGQGRVTLVESVGKKANFLKAVTRALDLPVIVENRRVEAISPSPFDLITARAFAPMPRLMGYIAPFWGQKTTGLFLKGENVDEELTEASESWTYAFEKLKSVSSTDSYVIKLTQLSPRG